MWVMIDEYGERFYECETCSELFDYREECGEHMDHYDHWPECESCFQTFWSQTACNQHMSALGHWAPDVPCETCKKMFHTQEQANEHMERFSHYKAYCKDCKIHFRNENNLNMHLNSKVHRGSKVSCPFCKVTYTTASGLAHHLETASCPRAPRLNRETIFRLIRERDPHGVLTNKQIEWHEGANTTFSATQRAFNGSHWMCSLCHKNFNTVTALNSHLNSATHKQKVYHCPNKKCGKEFVALAGVLSHLESGKCAFMRFEKVQQQVGNLFQGRKQIAFY